MFVLCRIQFNAACGFAFVLFKCTILFDVFLLCFGSGSFSLHLSLNGDSIEGGELFDRVIDDEFVLTEKTCTVFVRQLCQAMEFVHSNNILHLDLKPENILCLTREGNRIKIIDFGLARRYDPDKKLQVSVDLHKFSIFLYSCSTQWTQVNQTESQCPLSEKCVCECAEVIYVNVR